MGFCDALVFERHVISFQHNRIDCSVVFVPLHMAYHFHATFFQVRDVGGIA